MCLHSAQLNNGPPLINKAKNDRHSLRGGPARGSATAAAQPYQPHISQTLPFQKKEGGKRRGKNKGKKNMKSDRNAGLFAVFTNERALGKQQTPLMKSQQA